MSEQLILEKLDNLEKQSDKLGEKVDKIEITVSLIAVQTERIDNMQIQIQALWGKNDEAFGTNGVVSQIKQFQAGCPREEIKVSFNRLLSTIGLLTTILSGCLIKLIMDSGSGQI